MRLTAKCVGDPLLPSPYFRLYFTCYFGFTNQAENPKVLYVQLVNILVVLDVLFVF